MIRQSNARHPVGWPSQRCCQHCRLHGPSAPCLPALPCPCLSSEGTIAAAKVLSASELDRCGRALAHECLEDCGDHVREVGCKAVLLDYLSPVWSLRSYCLAGLRRDRTVSPWVALAWDVGQRVYSGMRHAQSTSGRAKPHGPAIPV